MAAARLEACCLAGTPRSSNVSCRSTAAAVRVTCATSQSSRHLKCNANRSSLSLRPGFEGARLLQQTGCCCHRASRKQVKVEARTSASEGRAIDKDPPSILWRVISALMYMVPYIDCIMMSRPFFSAFPTLSILLWIPAPFSNIYFSSQFTPLVIFFLLYLAVVKNQKLQHFVRFHTMQAVMVDIVVMLFQLLRYYLPREIRISFLADWFLKLAFGFCISTILYCMFFALRGMYADIPFVSESVYLQVDASELG